MAARKAKPKPPKSKPTCAVCAHRHRADITRCLTEDPNALTYAASRWDLPIAALLAHARTCMRAGAVHELARFAAILDTVEKKIEELFGDLAEAEGGICANDIRALVHSLEMIRKMRHGDLRVTGQLATPTDVVRSPTFKAAYRAVLDALDPWPDAQDRAEEVLQEFAGEW